jgi:trehalose 6-phosphate synthase
LKQLESILLCSHRGPVSYRGDEPVAAGPGGLVSVVAPALETISGKWLFAPSSDDDRRLARSGASLRPGSVTLQMLDLPLEAHRDHYATVSTEVLSSLFHYMFELPLEPRLGDDFRRAWAGYRRVNQIYGRAIVEQHHDYGGVLVEDMHLMLAGAEARAAGAVDAPLSYFHHVPWCAPEAFGAFPSPMRTEILASMLAYDYAGFHCTRWASSFTACCERFLPDVRAHDDGIEWRGRLTRLVIAPAAIDANAIRARASAAPTLDWRARLSEECGDRRVVVRVERGDPSKNTLRGIEAYELLLERGCTTAADTCLLAVITPVRQWIPLYQRYVAACETAVARVNERFPGNPVVLSLAPDPFVNDHHRALAALSLADVVVVGSIYDGLNLVAMEAAVTGEAGLVLSENTGAHEYLGPFALSVNPFDTSETADQLERALVEPEADRVRAAAGRRSFVESRGPADWVRSRLPGVPFLASLPVSGAQPAPSTELGLVDG